MPYKDPVKHREYMRVWQRTRRAEWLRGKLCAWCGATDRLELDHIDPSTKVAHRIWTWATERREGEIAKCRVLCRKCHAKRHGPQHRKIKAPPLP